MKPLRIGINGFGRIGRCILRAYAEHTKRGGIEIAAINIGSSNIKDALHLLKYDSSHGIFHNFHQSGENSIQIDSGNEIRVIQEREIAKINWSELGVDAVLECTGAFNEREKSYQHINSGASKVIVSAPCKNADATIVHGVNENILKQEHDVISIGSCTTNCLAPVAKILDDSIGIVNGFMTTVHSYTNDQALLDARHKDKRRARAAALSIIPTSTGAAKSLQLVLPNLAGKLDGTALRVPTPNVSMIDLKINVPRGTSVEEINSLMKDASKSQMEGILGFTDEELVSIDFNHNPHSAIFDATQTKVISDTFCRVVAWYDNEWGFSHRMLDTVVLVGKQI